MIGWEDGLRKGGSGYLVNLIKLFDALAGSEDDGWRVLGGVGGCHYYDFGRSGVICMVESMYDLYSNKPEDLSRGGNYILDLLY